MAWGPEERRRLYGTMRRTFFVLGLVASASLFASLAVLTLVADSPLVARWFLASAFVAGVCFGCALLAYRAER
ncbi:MAG: hypothetical protein KatS3mg076_0429 [Candidatus Binatia bacterium]|nr:MAG: hypothetical protein KatS3mg076_0429 [Candidatus Binatia bacterium]